MVGMIHRREEEWAEPPFASLRALADFVADFSEIVQEAMPDPPRKISAQVSYDHGDTGWLSPQELTEAASDLAPLREIKRFHAISGFVNEDGSKEGADKSAFRASIYISPWSSTTLGVEGRKLTAVEGVFGAAKAAVERHDKERLLAEKEAEKKERERERQAETAAAIIKADTDRSREREASPNPPLPAEGQPSRHGSKGSEGARSRSRVRRFAYDPWTITVGGGIIVAAVVILLTQT